MYCPIPDSPEYIEIVTVLTKHFKEANRKNPEEAAKEAAHDIFNKNKGHYLDKAPNGNPSMLFNDLVKLVGRDTAVFYKANMFAEDFYRWFGGEWFNKQFDHADQNGEPIIEDAAITNNTGKQTKINLRGAGPKVEDSPKTKQRPKREPSPNQEGYFYKIQEDNNGVKLDEGEGSYVSEDGKRYPRLTEWLRPKFTYDNEEERSQTLEEYISRKDFLTRGLNPVEDRISLQNELGDVVEYTFQEYLEYKHKQLEKNRSFGRVGHLLMENMFDSADKERITNDLSKEVNAHGIDLSDFSYLEKNKERIFYLLGLSESDKILAEQTLYSDLFNVGTRADGIVIHDNGDISIGDFKFGNIYANELTVKMMKYAPDHALGRMNKSRLNNAKMEVVMRAIMLKMQNPEILFRDLWVAKIDKKNLAQRETIILQDYLDTIGNYYMANDRKVYDELVEKDMLNASKYWGVSQEFAESEYESQIRSTAGQQTDNMSGRLKYLLEEINLLSNRIDALQYGEEGHSRGERAKLIEELSEQREGKMKIVLQLESGLGNDALFNLHEDINGFDRYFANLHELKSPVINAFSTVLFKQKDQGRMKLNDMKIRHDALLQSVLKDYMVQRNIPVIANKIGLNSLLNSGMNTYRGDGTGIFDFAYVNKFGHLGEGFYLVTEADPKWQQLTENQKQYIKFVTDEMNNAWKEAAIYKKHIIKGKKTLNKAEALGVNVDRKIYKDSGDLMPGFLPRVEPSASELSERSGYNLDKTQKAYRKAWWNDFAKADFNQEGEDRHIPLKYLGNSERVASGDYSFDLENVFNKFMTNMVMSQELDEVYSLGKALKDFMSVEYKKRGLTRPKILGFLEDQIRMHLLEERDAEANVLSIAFVDKDGVKRRIGLGSLARIIRGITTRIAMWFKPINAAKNFGLIAVMNHKTAGVGDIAKRFLGVDPNSVDFDHSSLAAAEADFLKLKSDILLGKEKENKLYLLLKHFNYMPDAYDYILRNNDKVVAKNKLISTSTPMFMNTFVEDFGTISVFGAFLRHMKVGEKNIWELYDIQNGQVVWNGGTRGVEEINTPAGKEYRPITELTEKEIIRLKRASQRIHGSYRQDERSAADLYAVGKLFLQFKKYLPAQLRGWFEGSKKDFSIGYYKPVDSKIVEWTDPATGKVSIIPVMEWYSQLSRGKFQLLVQSLGFITPIIARLPGGAAVLNKLGFDATAGSWKAFTEQLKDNPQLSQQLTHAYLNVALFILATLAYGAIFPDDEDKKTVLGRKASLFKEDMLEGANPVDLVRTLDKPVASVHQLYTITTAFSKFIPDLISGERQKDGKLHGQTSLTKSLPIVSGIYDLGHFNEEWYNYHWTNNETTMR